MRFLILFPVLVLGLFMAVPANASQPITGLWLTEDGDAVVRLYACGDTLCGRFYWIAPSRGGENQTDDHNRDPDKRLRPLCDMQFMGGFKKDGDRDYSGGWIYNPSDGQKYSADLSLQDDGTLNLQGYVLLPVFGESQVWTRVDTHPSCKEAKP